MVEVLSGVAQFSHSLSRELDALGVCADVTVVLDVPRGYAVATIPSLDRSSLLIAVTWNSCPEHLRELMEHQPDALLLGEKLGCDLASAVRDTVPQLLQGEVLRPRSSILSTSLTRAEEQVLRYLARGWTAERIAEELHVIPHTIGNRLSEIYSKLGVDNDRDAVLYYWGIRELFHKER